MRVLRARYVASEDTVDLRWGTALALAALWIVIAQLVPAGPLRAIVALPVLVLVPGWAAFVALFGTARQPESVTKFVFIVSLGLSVEVLDGLVLNSVSLGLGTLPLLLAAGVSSGLFLLVARIRGGNPKLTIAAGPDTRRTAARTLAFLTAVGFLALTVTVVGSDLRQPDQRTFAQLSFAPGSVSGPVPITADPGAKLKLPVEVRLHGLTAQTYQVLVTMDGVISDTEQVTMRAPIWSQTFFVSMPIGNCLHRAQVRLVPTNRSAPVASIDEYFLGHDRKSCGS